MATKKTTHFDDDILHKFMINIVPETRFTGILYKIKISTYRSELVFFYLDNPNFL